VTIGSRVVQFSVSRPKVVTLVMVALTLVFALVAALPTLWPTIFTALNPLKVDTDPENMLPEDEPVRLYHNNMKREMSLYDMVVVGIVNESDPDGVFNPESLRRIYELTEYARTLRWPDEDNPDRHVGVREVDIIAPSTVDNIEQGGPGVVRFEWLMPSPPTTREGCLAIREKAERIPFLDGTLLSEDGKALCLYLPLTSKDLSYKVYTHLEEKVRSFAGDDQFHITGLPVAEDTFGVEMFKQMAISAPIAMVVVFLFLLLFFRKLILIISPMIVALVSIICTMGLLIATGQTVHIMSSMIPIFIMPIAVLDAIHILSEFFDRYQETKDRRKTIEHVMETLFTPMLYTSLTTAVGFASLALTPIPPVQVFGLFVTFGVMSAWLWTVMFIPAFVMFIPDKSLEGFGATHKESDTKAASPLTRFLAGVGRMTYRRAKPVIGVVVLLIAVAVYGITRIEINDNPVRWFTKSHPIRVADRVLNDHFGGTYMAYLALEAQPTTEDPRQYAAALSDRMAVRGKELQEQIPHVKEVFGSAHNEAARLATVASSKEDLLSRLASFAEGRMERAPDDQFEAWYELQLFIDEERQRDQVFKQPEALDYLAALQQHLLTTGVVGKSNSLADIVKTVYRELISGKPGDFRIPDSANAVAQCLITYESSHRPQDLAHFVTQPDYRKTVIWVQLTSGDNKDMSKVVDAVDRYVETHPPPYPIDHRWFGLTYINVIWQRKMVSGMLQSFLGSFLTVFLMMTLLYRSGLWGLLSMIPLTVTIGLIYGATGLVGKDYDMPVAVLSSLTLGLAVDYAIHFLSRSRMLYATHKSWAETVAPVFGEPARAITRNAIVVGVGFLPLLLAPLVPYQTVGVFIASILLTAGLATLFILPALITLLERLLFPRTRLCCLFCRCTTCIVAAAAGVAVIAMNVRRFLSVGWTSLTLVSVGTIVILAVICRLAARRDKCKTVYLDEEGGETQ